MEICDVRLTCIQMFYMVIIQSKGGLYNVMAVILPAITFINPWQADNQCQFS